MNHNPRRGETVGPFVATAQSVAGSHYDGTMFADPLTILDNKGTVIVPAGEPIWVYDEPSYVDPATVVVIVRERSFRAAPADVVAAWRAA